MTMMDREDADVQRERRAAQRKIESEFEMPTDDLFVGMQVMIGQPGVTGMILASIERIAATYLTVIIPGPKRITDILHIDDPRHNNPDRRDGIMGYWTHTDYTEHLQSEAAVLHERIANLEKIVETLSIPVPGAPAKKKPVDPELAELRARAKELKIPKAHLLGKKKLQIALGEMNAT